MAASPQTKNYLYGKGELFFRAEGSEGYDHLGNAPAFTISLTRPSRAGQSPHGGKAPILPPAFGAGAFLASLPFRKEQSPRTSSRHFEAAPCRTLPHPPSLFHITLFLHG